MSKVLIIPGFSVTNRLLMYASVLLAPAQFVSGLGNNCPSNIGFLAYNLYTQALFNRAVRADRLHALCLAIPHFNILYAMSYIGGVSSGNIVMGSILGFGTAAALLLNSVSAWIACIQNQPKGFGDYRFFIAGWHTLTGNWHTFFMVWEGFNTLWTVFNAIIALAVAFQAPEEADDKGCWSKYVSTLVTIPVGAAVAMCALWPLVLFVELIVSSNHIESATDWTAVWLFIAQVVTMLVPPLCSYCED